MIVLKKKTLIIALILLVVICGFTGGASVYALNTKDSPTIVIDAGHGSIDGGVSGVTTNVKESDLNLIYSKMLADKLRLKGYSVVLTRTTQDSLSNSKKEDMQLRKKIIESACPNLILSVHMNKYKDKNRRGAQVFYDDTNKWESSAKILQGTLNEHLNKKYVGRSDFSPQKGDYFMTKCYNCPSLILECGFLSSPEDEKLLTTPAYQSELLDIVILAVDAICTVASGNC